MGEITEEEKRRETAQSDKERKEKKSMCVEEIKTKTNRIKGNDTNRQKEGERREQSGRRGSAA